MAKKDKKKKKDDYDPNRYAIEEVIETISESPNSNWGKFLVKGRMDDSPSTIDIRHLRLGSKQIVGKGISLTDAECDTLTNALVKRGYGSVDVFDQEKRHRRQQFGFDDTPEDDGMYRVEVDL